MKKFTFQDRKKIQHFRSLLPNTIEVQVSLSKDSGYFAEILTFPGCITQSETFSELIEMVNDAVYTVLEIPRKYLIHMPTYLPSLSLAQRFNIFPSQIVKKPIPFSIQFRENICD